MIRIQSAPLDIESELQAYRLSSPDYGALASFEGYVRSEHGNVTALELQHYPAVTEAEIARFERQNTGNLPSKLSTFLWII